MFVKAPALPRSCMAVRKNGKNVQGQKMLRQLLVLALQPTLAAQELETYAASLLPLDQQTAVTAVLQRIPGTCLNSPTQRSSSQHGQYWFYNATGEGLMMGLDLAGIAVSTGSACAAGSLEPSHVLLALGRDPDAAKSALRFSVGKDTTATDIDHLLDILPGVVERVRAARLQ